MPWNILLLPLLGGFIFVRYWNRTKYHAIRADKERLLLLAATAGLVSLAVSFIVKQIAGWLLPCVSFPSFPCFPNIWYRFFPFPYSAVSVLAFLMGAVLWVPLNKGVITWTKSLSKSETWEPIGTLYRTILRLGWIEKDEIDRVIKEDGDALDMLLRLAEKESKTISVTLTTGKVYVGFVSSTSPPSSETRSVGIVPTKSGYRDPLTKKVLYETYYSDALTRINEDIDKRIGDIKGIRRAFRRLRRDWIRKRELVAKAKDQEAKNGLLAEVETVRTQLEQLREREGELRDEVNNLASIINDFRLVFPITQISTISIYREEVNIEYFAHQDGDEIKSPSSVARDPQSELP